MSVATPLLDNTIEPDDPGVGLSGNINSSNNASNTRPPVVLIPTNRANQTSNPGPAYASTQSDAESGIAGIFRQSAHPVALFFLFLFRIAAIGVYIVSGFFTDSYVLFTVIVVVLLAMDFWNCRNVSGRTLVGLRFWNQVDDDGESYWVFESRDPSRPVNPIDSRMFYIALYVFPVLWATLLIVSLLKLGLAFIPIVVLALVFNVTNAVGFTYADRDAKQRWASSMSSGWGIPGLSGIGGQLLTGAVQKSVGRMFS
ncbi:Golgi apparatus membrane protein TVP23 [Dendrothele bispora CBS 962.96]|uniref:Golgi apparatus membrane protein TVP23 n=1 Tax=Dendrothele bispora (strain CBS 962.96) TaxID=1314807 RepID=A0A4S8LZ88_DENBC|nr:Golgi apparatus membrane protein TVP23 [Dendrothele bispora CBS 962.96]